MLDCILTRRNASSPHRLIASSIFCFVFCLQAAYAAQTESALSYAQKGYAHLRDGELKEALDCYKQAIKTDPTMTEAHIGLGLVYIAQSDFEKAVNEFDSSIKLDPRSYEAFCNRGVAYSRLLNYDKALSDLKRALQLKPDYEPAIYDLGFLYQLQGKYEEAINQYKEVLKHDPNPNPNSNSNLAIVHHNLARCYAKLGKLEEAKRESEIAKKVREYNGKVQQAQERLQNNPLDPEAYMSLASIYLEYGEMEAYSELADILIRRGELEAASEMYKQVIKIKPDYLMAYTLLGMIYKRMGKSDEAAIQLNLALKLAKKAIDVEATAANLNKLALVYLAMGEYDEAEMALKRAVELEPQNEKYKRQLKQIKDALKRN